ncbi:MAG: M48 family metallopeptidase [Anaerofustis stercorihominis]|nr:M48 family metallopeptidase [Anaerofustis stercorihominis]
MISTFNGIPVQTIRSKRKTLAIQIDDSGLIVRVPMRMSERDILAFLNEKQGWIEKHWRKRLRQKSEGESLPPLTSDDIRALADKALSVIPAKVAYYAERIGVDYGRITIRNQRTRWGSCSDKGNLNFNCLLMLMPDKIVDSVVVHELCHRKHMNHSKEFYAEIEKVFPDYDECRKWLKDHGGEVMRRMQ